MLKVILDTLDDVPEALHQYYTQKDEKYVLQIADVDNHPDVSNLRNAYQAEKTKRQESGNKLASLEERLKAIPDDFDAEVWKRAKEGGKSDPAELQQVRAQLEAERDEWKGKASAHEKRIYELTVERELDGVLAASGVTEPAFQKAARALLTPSIKMTDDGKPVVETDMGPLPMGDYVQRWVSGDEGKAFVSNPKGADAKGGNGRPSGHGSGDMGGDKNARANAIAQKFNIPLS